MKVFVIMMPTYRSRHVLEITTTLSVAKNIMCQAMGIHPGKFHDMNPSYWWDQETRSGGITTHIVGTAGDPSVSGWSIEEHTVRVNVLEELK